jgi:hypothetical protein
MKQTQRLLMILFITSIVLPLAMVVLFETGIIATGIMAGDTQSEFLLTSTMELVTLAFAFLSLRLFKFGRIHADLVNRQEKALLKWGYLRLLLIQAPLVINTLLYYFFGFEPAFGYLAVITLLSMVFILPTTNRCVAETTDEPTEDSEQKREAFNEEEQA